MKTPDATRPGGTLRKRQRGRVLLRLIIFKDEPRPGQVAIKAIREDILGVEKVWRERKVLTQIRGLDNAHLIKHFATCKRKNDDRLFIIFPLATRGSIQKFWGEEDERAKKEREKEEREKKEREKEEREKKEREKEKRWRDRDLVLWSVEQMLGLARAVHDLHYGLKGENDETHCRHGDIKPANILVFEDPRSGELRLVLSDLGVSAIHVKQTAVRTSITKTEATTREYEAPEAHERSAGHDQPRPRSYDIWSLGCVFLEFVVWILYDLKTIERFKENRYEQHKNSHKSFYHITPDRQAVVRPEVREVTAALMDDPRCRGRTALGDLVRLIDTKLLVTAVEGRALSPGTTTIRYEAKALVKELSKIVERAKADPSYWLNEADAPLIPPNAFLPPGGNSRRGSVTQM